MQFAIRALRATAQYLLLCFISIVSLPAISQVVVHTSDFIADDVRSAFNGFEAFTDNVAYSNVHIEDGIKVEHVGVFRDVWTATYTRSGFEGQRLWYALTDQLTNTGYERITLTSGNTFGAVGMLVGSGFGGYCVLSECDTVAPYLTVYYELFNQGVSVAAGNLSPYNPNGHYLGFSGVTFDEIHLWDHAAGAWEGQSALMLDSIEVAAPVPEPMSSLLWLAGLLIMAFTMQRRNGVRDVQAVYNATGESN